MVTTALMVLTMSSPIIVILGLLALAGWRDRRREAIIARQIRLTDAIADQLGAIVAPVVTKPLGRPWRVDIHVPVGRPATVSRIVGIAHDTLTRTGAGRYELVLTPDVTPASVLRSVSRTAGRLQAA
jgi:hypothetical protein